MPAEAAEAAAQQTPSTAAVAAAPVLGPPRACAKHDVHQLGPLQTAALQTHSELTLVSMRRHNHACLPVWMLTESLHDVRELRLLQRCCVYLPIRQAASNVSQL